MHFNSKLSARVVVKMFIKCGNPNEKTNAAAACSSV